MERIDETGKESADSGEPTGERKVSKRYKVVRYDRPKAQE